MKTQKERIFPSVEFRRFSSYLTMSFGILQLVDIYHRGGLYSVASAFDSESCWRGYCFVFLGKTYGLLTKCEVKMAGYWPSFFFACLWTETESRSINTKEFGQYQTILTEQARSIKDLLYEFWGNFLRDKAGSPERARWLHLARSGSQSQRRI